jgi:hypothetical protein
MSTKVKLQDVRIAFCSSLFEPVQYQGKGVARHSATFLIEPGSANDKAIRAAIKAEATALWPKNADAKVKAIEGNSNKFCYQSGDSKDYDGFAGMMFIAAHRKETDGAPTVIDRDKSPLSAKSGKPYGGCFVNAIVDIYAQDGENSGMRCGLGAVQFVRDGDSFGGARKVDHSEFDDLSTADEEPSLV